MLSEYLSKFSTFSNGVSFTGVPLISKILSPICNDIKSVFISNLKPLRCLTIYANINRDKLVMLINHIPAWVRQKVAANVKSIG